MTLHTILRDDVIAPQSVDSPQYAPWPLFLSAVLAVLGLGVLCAWVVW